MILQLHRFYPVTYHFYAYDTAKKDPQFHSMIEFLHELNADLMKNKKTLHRNGLFNQKKDHSHRHHKFYRHLKCPIPEADSDMLPKIFA